MDNSVNTALTAVATTLKDNVNPGVVGGIIGLVLGSGVLIYLTWFGAKKLISVVRNALKGRLSV